MLLPGNGNDSVMSSVMLSMTGWKSKAVAINGWNFKHASDV